MRFLVSEVPLYASDTHIRTIGQNLQPNLPNRTGMHPTRFRGGLVFRAHRLLYHSTLGLRVIKKTRSATSRFYKVGDAANAHKLRANFTLYTTFNPPPRLQSFLDRPRSQVFGGSAAAQKASVTSCTDIRASCPNIQKAMRHILPGYSGVR